MSLPVTVGQYERNASCEKSVRYGRVSYAIGREVGYQVRGAVGDSTKAVYVANTMDALYGITVGSSSISCPAIVSLIGSGTELDGDVEALIDLGCSMIIESQVDSVEGADAALWFLNGLLEGLQEEDLQ